MADSKLSSLTELTSGNVAAADELYIHDASAADSAASKRVLVSSIGRYVNSYNTIYNVVDYGAVGDGTTDDTAALQAALDAVPAGGGTVYLPTGEYLTDLLTITTNGTKLYGEGYSSVLKGSSGTEAAVLKVGNGSEPFTLDVTLRDFRIAGAAVKGLHIDFSILMHIENISMDDNFTGTDGFVFDTCFASVLMNLRTNGATISGSCFKIGDDFNANTATNLYTTNTCAINIEVDGGHGSTFNTPCCQGGDVGLWVKSGNNHTFNALYTETTAIACRLGVDGGTITNILTFNAPEFAAATSSHRNYASRVGSLQIDNANSVFITTPNFSGNFNAYNDVTVSITGGGGSGAEAIARVHPDGNIHSVHVTRPGTGYSSDPTIGFSGTGSGATATATRSGTELASVTVTDGGTGYAAANTNPVSIWYKTAHRIKIINPLASLYNGGNPAFYASICRQAGAASTSRIAVESMYTDRVDNSAIGYGTLVPARGFGYQHYVQDIENALSGGELDDEVWSYVPPEFTT